MTLQGSFGILENLPSSRMTTNKSKLKTCSRGHQFYKSSDCPTCPVCEQERRSETGFLSLLSAPARRALENNGITTIEELAKRTRKEIMSFHGMGKGSIPALQAALTQKGLKFKEN